MKNKLPFLYNVMPHSITGHQPHKFMFGCKAHAICDAWLGLAHYNDQISTNQCAWLNEQHELLMSVNRQALKHIQQSAKKSQARAGGKMFHIPIGNLVLLRTILRVGTKFSTTISLSCLSLLPIIMTPMYTLYSH